MLWLEKVWWGWKSRWKNIVHIFFIWYGSIWLIVESLGAFDKASFSFLQNLTVLCWSIVISLLASLGRNFFRTSISFELPHSNTTLRIKFSDFFNQAGVKVVPANEFFDGEIGPIVSATSVHGQFISKHFGGQATAFNAALTAALSQLSGTTTARKQGNNVQYPIGSSVTLGIGPDTYILFALCRTNLQTHKAETDLPTYMEAMGKLWSAVRNTSNGRPVSIPLVGTGLSGIGLPSAQMLDLLILSFIEANKRQEVCRELTVVLFPSRFAEFNLLDTQEAWS